MKWWWNKKPSEHIELDQQGVRRVRGTEVFESVAWRELVRVAIMTTDEGPFLEDWFWVLRADDGTGCAIGQARASEVDLLGALQRLPRFNHLAVIEAAGSTEWHEFLCWEGEPGEGWAAAPGNGGAKQQEA